MCSFFAVASLLCFRIFMFVTFSNVKCWYRFFLTGAGNFTLTESSANNQKLALKPLKQLPCFHLSRFFYHLHRSLSLFRNIFHMKYNLSKKQHIKKSVELMHCHIHSVNDVVIVGFFFLFEPRYINFFVLLLLVHCS